VEIELVLQTRGPDHIASVLDALHGGGFQAQRQ
jgi:threonine dehydratase